jgi:hypothetical protein
VGIFPVQYGLKGQMRPVARTAAIGFIAKGAGNPVLSAIYDNDAVLNIPKDFNFGDDFDDFDQILDKFSKHA